jgi:hypothetical protein
VLSVCECRRNASVEMSRKTRHLNLRGRKADRQETDGRVCLLTISRTRRRRRSRSSRMTSGEVLAMLAILRRQADELERAGGQRCRPRCCWPKSCGRRPKSRTPENERPRAAGTAGSRLAVRRVGDDLRRPDDALGARAAAARSRSARRSAPASRHLGAPHAGPLVVSTQRVGCGIGVGTSPTTSRFASCR